MEPVTAACYQTLLAAVGVPKVESRTEDVNDAPSQLSTFFPQPNESQQTALDAKASQGIG